MADTIKKNKNETIMYAEPKNVTTVYKTSGMPAPTGSEQIGKTKLDAPAKTRGLEPAKTAQIDIRGYFGDERDGIRKAGVGTPRKPSVHQKMMAYSDAQAAKLRAKKAAPPKAPARKLTEINIPGGGSRAAKPTSAKTSRPYTASEARSLAPGNYRSGKVTMGGKTYTGFTVGSSTDSKGRTTKSVGNWTSTKDAGRSADSKGSFGMSAPKGSLFGGSKKSSSTSGKKK
jgi:hypothetical protein